MDSNFPFFIKNLNKTSQFNLPQKSQMNYKLGRVLFITILMGWSEIKGVITIQESNAGFV
jgi:hypothetical protein